MKNNNYLYKNIEPFFKRPKLMNKNTAIILLRPKQTHSVKHFYENILRTCIFCGISKGENNSILEAIDRSYYGHCLLVLGPIFSISS